MKLQTLHEARTSNAPRGTILNRVLELLREKNPNATQETVAKLAAYIEAENGPPEDFWNVLYHGVKPMKNDITEVERVFREMYEDQEDTEGNIDFADFDHEVLWFYKSAPFKV
jgi:hypothetical protein